MSITSILKQAFAHFSSDFWILLILLRALKVSYHKVTFYFQTKVQEESNFNYTSNWIKRKAFAKIVLGDFNVQLVKEDDMQRDTVYKF